MNNQSNVKTTADKAAFLNEWLAKNVTYTTTYGELTTASPTGALVDKKATCQGFSLAYSYLCRKAGIPCLFVAGAKENVGPHSWNYVKIDNKWYFVDTSANSKYNYINKTCSYYYYYFLRSMPSTYNDDETRNNYPLPYSVNDYYITYGDMNSDGKITEADAERLLEYVQNNESVDFTLTQLIAAEVNADGEINAADAAQIRVKSINPSYKFGIIKQIESLN